VAQSFSHVQLGTDVAQALDTGRPIVALESAVLTHGLPHPAHLEALHRMDSAVRAGGATPALCLVAEGSLWIGADGAMAERVSDDPGRQKASVRDLGRVIALRTSAGLTVSATLHAATVAGISVFATGGIGGVHKGAATSGDVSADLLQLSRSPVITVCSGAKNVLDIPRTLEFLEMAAVPVFAFQTTSFPAFYLIDSGEVAVEIANAREIALVAAAHWSLGQTAGVLVANPIPPSYALDPNDWEAWMRVAHQRATAHSVTGNEVTPYLLAQVAELSSGETVTANLALLESNARLAGEIASALIR
jgi:pseudouridylate synthase